MVAEHRRDKPVVLPRPQTPADPRPTEPIVVHGNTTTMTGFAGLLAGAADGPVQFSG